MGNPWPKKKNILIMGCENRKPLDIPDGEPIISELVPYPPVLDISTFKVPKENIKGVGRSEEDSEFPEDEDETGKRQKFLRAFRHKEVGVTVCVSTKMRNADQLPNVPEIGHLFFVSPNKAWKENPDSPKARVKAYRWLDPEDSEIKGRVQTIQYQLPFLGSDHEECYGELQIRIKRTEVEDGKIVRLEPVAIGRQASFDSRAGKWLLETKAMTPKCDRGSHAYISLRLYHQGHLPANQGGWHWEPVYVAIDRQFFYAIYASWSDDMVTIIVRLLDSDDPQIPSYLK